MIICTAYRAGGVYDEEDIRQLARQIAVHSDRILWVFTCDKIDYPHVIRHGYEYPGWWCKMSLFDTALSPHDLFYVDLDTMIRRDIRELVQILEDMDRAFILRDVYRRGGLQSSVMYIPHRYKPLVWKEWRVHPLAWMSRFKQEGDQGFLEKFSFWHFFQPKLANYFASYKEDVLKQTPAGRLAPVVFFHGQPKPRDLQWNSSRL